MITGRPLKLTIGKDNLPPRLPNLALMLRDFFWPVTGDQAPPTSRGVSRGGGKITPKITAQGQRAAGREPCE